MNNRLKRVNRSGAMAVVMGLGIFASHAPAADTGITVSGTGEAKAKPTSVEMNATVAADAELTADAVVKFNDARKKSMSALEGLKLPNLTVTPLGMSVATAADDQAQMRMMNGIAGGATTPPKTKISEQLKIIINGADQVEPADLIGLIMKVVDSGRDAGLTVGPPTARNYYEAQMMAQSGVGNMVAQFRIDDATKIRDEAYKLAMQDARSKAEKLANLAGVKLGPVVVVQESTAPPTDPQMAMMMRMVGMPTSTGSGAGATSSTFSDISVKVAVTVQFAIEK